MTRNLEMPVGFDALQEKLDDMLLRKEAYSKCGVSLPHFVVILPEGDGRTKLAAYLAKFYRHHKLCRFSGRESFLEYKLDGTMAQLNKLFEKIEDETIYSNEYCAVLALDIMGLCSCMDDEETLPYFLDRIKEVGRNTTMVFFCPRELTRNQTRLMQMTEEKLGEMKQVEIPPYAAEDLTQIILSALDEMGVTVAADLTELLLSLVEKEKILTAKAAAAFAEKLTLLADFSGFTPRLSRENVTAAFGDRKEMTV